MILINRLYRDRVIFLGTEVDSFLSNQLIALILYLSLEAENKDMFFFLNTPGGYLVPGVALYDTIQFVKTDIATICMGLAASMGSFLLAGGAFNKRLAFPHARRQ